MNLLDQIENKSKNHTLYAFWDLEVSPATFDIVKFILLAELERIRLECTFLHVVIVPGSAEGFRVNDLQSYRNLGSRDCDNEYMKWRLRNLLVPCCWMIPSCSQITICTSREEALLFEKFLVKYIFPKQYTVNSPIAYYQEKYVTEAASRQILPTIRANLQARHFVSDWIRTNTDRRKVVTITLRESSYEPKRNSNLKDWKGFVEQLDLDVYCPVVIRDIEAAFKPLPHELDGLLIFSEVIWNMEIRAALYELSYLNMIESNGLALCMYNRQTRYLAFKMIAPGAGAGATSVYYLQSQGLVYGSQWPWTTPLQRMIWEDSNLEVIQNAFKEMCDRIESFSTATLPDLINFFNEMLNKNDVNNAEWVSSLLTERFGDHYVAWHVRAIALRLTNQPKEALSAIERSLRLHAAPDSLAELIRIYQALGLHDKAAQLSKDIAKAQELKQPLTLQF